jgi:hypothetical protein
MNLNKLCFAVVAVAIAAASHADLLPTEAELPKKLSEIDATVGSTTSINAYVHQKRKDYSTDVFCGATKVGKLEFQSSAYTGDFDGGNLNDFGGFIIRGGFKLAPGFTVMPGATMRWLQVVTTSNEKQNNSNVAGRRFVDGSPFYPDFPIAGYAASLFDAPGRSMNNGAGWQNLTWRAESALVCVDEVKKKIFYMGAFTYGFDITTNVRTQAVTGTYPGGWGAGVTQGFKDQFAAEYGNYTLEAGCCVVPEPATMAALAVGLAAMARRRRRAIGS